MANADFNPYLELEVPRDADPAAIKSAYRRRAKKVHPDKGGSADQMSRASRALAILGDPVRREKFDRDGTVDDAVDNERAKALDVINTHINAVVNRYVAKFDPGLDPRRHDVIAVITQAIRGEIGQTEAALANGEKFLELTKDLKSRFSTTDAATPIERSFDVRIQQTISELDEGRRHVTIRRRALQILKTYKFRWDAPSYVQWSSTSTAG